MSLHLNKEEAAIYEGTTRICTLETYSGIRSGVAESWGARIVECCNDHDQMLVLLMEAAKPNRAKDLTARINSFLLLRGAA